MYAVSRQESLISPVYLSFFAGVVSASVAWYCLVGGSRRTRNNNSEYENYDNKNNSSDHDDERQPPNFLRWMSMEDIKSRIGELPSSLRHSRRGHWPWDQQKHRSSSRSNSFAEQEQEEQPPTATEAAAATTTTTTTNDSTIPPSPSHLPPHHDESSNKKSDYCIGSIFGLDVGGTLAKLVYFEQKCDETVVNSEFHPQFRERSYRSRASAQAVLLARRGLVVVDDDTDSNNNGEDEHNPVASPPPHLRRRPRSQSTTVEAGHRTLLPLGSSSESSARRLSKFGSGGGSVRHLHKQQHQHHSTASNDDLKLLYNLRQESVPDDLHVYAASIHLKQQQRTWFHTTESMEEMLKAKQQQQQQQSAMNNSNSETQNGGTDGTGTTGTTTTNTAGSSSTTTTSTSNMRKSRSMFDFSEGRIEALDRFYTFAHRLDSYREGIKDHNLSFYCRQLGGDFHFIRFETRRMQNAMDLIRANQLHLNIREMGATGGGAHKYATIWKHELGIEMQKQDELDSLVAGMQFVLSGVLGECYTFRPNNKQTATKSDNNNNNVGGLSRSSSASDFTIGAPLDDDDDDDDDVNTEEETATESTPSQDRGKGDNWWWSRKVKRDAISYSETYPYMLVTIGTGVSILRVDGPRKHERVSGSTIGGGTYWGLIRLLTDVEDFEDAMRLAERGDASKVDMMVGDIYGEKSTVLEKIGLASDLVASSFGKLVAKDDPAKDLKQEDLARALLLMVTINIGQVAYLNAKMHKTPRIYFVGNFLRDNKISQRRLSFAIDYWSKGEMEALFLEHEGYFGALGAFLLSQGIDGASDHPPPLRRSQTSTPGVPGTKPATETTTNGKRPSLLHRRSSTSDTLL